MITNAGQVLHLEWLIALARLIHSKEEKQRGNPGDRWWHGPWWQQREVEKGPTSAYILNAGPTGLTDEWERRVESRRHQRSWPRELCGLLSDEINFSRPKKLQKLWLIQSRTASFTEGVLLASNMMMRVVRLQEGGECTGFLSCHSSQESPGSTSGTRCQTDLRGGGVATLICWSW